MANRKCSVHYYFNILRHKVVTVNFDPMVTTALMGVKLRGKAL